MKDLYKLLETPNNKLNHSAVLKKQRFKLWLEDRKCCYCGKITVFFNRCGNNSNSEFRPLTNEATIEHIYDRTSKKRKTANKNNEKRHYIACYECNYERGKGIKKVFSNPVIS